MTTSEMFKGFLGNLAIKNSDVIRASYEEITACLNKKIRGSTSKEENTLRVGSYGRWTGIHGISDLDMLYIMPANVRHNYNNSKQAKLLTDIKDVITARYPNTDIRVNRCVVRIQYVKFKVEIQPVFKQEDGSFEYPDTANGGAWKITKPSDEIKAMKQFVDQKNKNLRKLCKITRAWKNTHGVEMGGLLIDTLAYNFLNSTTVYDDKSFSYYSWMCRDFFKYLSNEPSKAYYLALGSNQQVKVKKEFQSKAKKAYNLCLKAIEADEDSSGDDWRMVFGRSFPAASTPMRETNSSLSYKNTEEFIENRYYTDIRYTLEIDCEVCQDKFREHYLSAMLAKMIPLLAKKKLTFRIKKINVPGEYIIAWKVLNRGKEAQKRDCIRGQIIPGDTPGIWNERNISKCTLTENTKFKGSHFVECYAIQHDVVVARGIINVPISNNGDTNE